MFSSAQALRKRWRRRVVREWKITRKNHQHPYDIFIYNHLYHIDIYIYMCVYMYWYLYIYIYIFIDIDIYCVCIYLCSYYYRFDFTAFPRFFSNFSPPFGRGLALRWTRWTSEAVNGAWVQRFIDLHQQHMEPLGWACGAWEMGPPELRYIVIYIYIYTYG